MIGDWVQVPCLIDNTENYNAWCQIRQLRDGDLDVIGFKELSYDEIEPIPLTPEILEKNGFYYGYTSNEEDLASNTIAQLSEDDKGWCWDEGDGVIKVIFPNEADGGLIFLDDQSFDRHFKMVFCETIFLHELQHALRLCRIEKEIIL